MTYVEDPEKGWISDVVEPALKGDSSGIVNDAKNCGYFYEPVASNDIPRRAGGWFTTRPHGEAASQQGEIVSNPPVRRLAVVSAGVVLGVSLAGCTPASSPEQTTTPGGSSSAVATATTCGAVSVIFANLQSADSDFRAGRITEAEWVSMTNLAKTDLDGIHMFRDWGLQDELSGLTDYMTTSEALPSGAQFDSTTDEFGGLQNDVRDACEANGSPVTTFATSGG
ncbi:MAG TPA: hypothetical protein VNJ54_21505 [Plantibacter sp.]|uniref:hypothetical protein n=1 Tax=unclassified Plantibacter TaxID=2624265 RepID=UPI002BE687C0|nr:hypothetical protein [Plantibacter sp.]